MSDSSDEAPFVRMLLGPVEPEAVGRFQNAIDKCVAAGQETLPVTILSPGGDPYSMTAMIDLIDHAPITIATIAVGYAASAGAFLLAAGTPGHRYVAPNSRVLVHEMLAGVEYGPTPDVVAEAAERADLNTYLMALLDKRTNHRSGYWQKKIRGKSYRDLTMRAADAVKEGLADKIGIPLVGLHQESSVMMIEPEKVAARKARG